MGILILLLPLLLLLQISRVNGHEQVNLVGSAGPYAQHSLWRVHNLTAADLSALDGFDIVSVHQNLRLTAEILMSMEDRLSISQFGTDYEMELIMDGHEIQRRINQASLSSRAQDCSQWFHSYHRYEEIKEWARALSEKQFPHLMRFVPSIGKTHEGRDIFALHISSSSGAEFTGKKPQIWIQGQIHAREWISGATVQYIIHQLVSLYGTNERVTNLLNRLEFIFIPCMNPDGYEYSHTDLRLWRKNRRPSDNGRGSGVDLNRNYDVHWHDNNGASRMPRSETYKGPSPASEPEVQALVQYFLKHDNIVGSIDFHSFSQLILRPYGFQNAPSPDETALKYNERHKKKRRMDKNHHDDERIAGGMDEPSWKSTVSNSSMLADASSTVVHVGAGERRVMTASAYKSSMGGNSNEVGGNREGGGGEQVERKVSIADRLSWPKERQVRHNSEGRHHYNNQRRRHAQ